MFLIRTRFLKGHESSRTRKYNIESKIPENQIYRQKTSTESNRISLAACAEDSLQTTNGSRLVNRCYYLDFP